MGKKKDYHSILNGFIQYCPGIAHFHAQIIKENIQEHLNPTIEGSGLNRFDKSVAYTLFFE